MIKYPRSFPGHNSMGYATHSFASGQVAWTLSAEEAKCRFLSVTLAGGAASIYAPLAPGKCFVLYNGSGQTITLLVKGVTGVAIANAKVAELFCTDTDYVRASADMSY